MKKNRIDLITRVFSLRNSTFDETTGSVKGVITTEKAALVYDWYTGDIIREILVMSGVVMPESKQIPLLDSHNRWSTSDIKGSIRNMEAVGDELIGDIVLSSAAQDEKTKIKEGHLTDLSAGYVPDRKKTIVLAKGQTAVINGTEYKNDYEDEAPLHIQPVWRILEGSLVAIGADDKAKLKELEVAEFQEDNTLDKPQIEIKAGEKYKMTDEEKKLQEFEQIEKYGKERFEGRFKSLAEESISKGLSYVEFTKAVFDEIQKKGSAYEKPITEVGMTEKEVETYSISRGINGLIENKRSGFEFEIHKELEKRGVEAKQGGLLLPYELQKRAHSAGTPSEGGYLVATDTRYDLMVENLRNDTVLGRLGATLLMGLKGNIEIPVIVSGLTAQAVAENSAATTTYLVLDQITASPNTISANSVFGRKLLTQAGVSVDQLIMRKLNEAMNLKKDYLGLNGTGLNNEPKGLLNWPGVNASDMTAASWKEILKFIRDLEIANAIADNMKWIESPHVKHVLGYTPVVEGRDRFIQDKGMIADYVAERTNQIASTILGLGNWPEVYLCFWGAQEMIVDPMTLSTTGQVRVSVFDEMDTVVGQPAAFTISDTVQIEE